MRPVSRWAHLMASNVSIAARTSQDGYGKPAYGTPVVYRAHLSKKRVIARNDHGQEVSSEKSLHLATTAHIEETAQVTLSTQDAGSTEEFALHPVIKAVERRYDQSGPHHVVVFL